MDMFNKIYSQVSSSVSTTVNHLQGVLPGNPVTREFAAVAHIASAGPCLAWKIYKGSKHSTKQEASIFVFEKRQLDKWNRTDKELILETLRKGIIQLTKIRHPQVLTVQHPLEESRESLAFATEPVFASLANILGETNNMPQPTNLSDFKLYDVEIKYGLLQISEGLAFLHNDVKLLHKNISPESIIINQQGAWKIFGFDFCIHNTSPPNSVPFFPCEEFSPTLPSYCQPNIEYLAPECVTLISNSTASDMFSLGMLSYTVHSRRTSLFPIKDLSQFKNRVQQLKNLNPSKLSCIPEDLRQYVQLTLNVTPELRPDAHQFAKIPYFEDLGVKTLNYLDCLLQWDNLQKSQFYKGLPEALSKLPQRVKVQRVLSCLVRDLSQPTMVPFILPSILDIAQECTQKEFRMYVLPHLKPVMKLMEPIQILLILLQRMELLLKLTPAEDVQQHVLPMLYRGLDSDTPQIHELCLAVLPTFAGLLDHSNVKNSLLPRIKKLCLSTSNLSVRVNCLLCIGRLLEHLDKWLVLDEVLPFLPQIPSREPAVLMGILGIYKLAMHHKKLGITKEIIASRILPFLIPLCIENGLTLTQFNAIVVLVKEMFALVENEHRTKLEQLNSVKDQQRTLAATMPSVLPETTPVELDKAFSGLGLDSFASPSSLQEKTKIAQQQENFKLFKNQSSIEPVKASPSTLQPVKDLSSSLMKDFMGVSQSKDFMSLSTSSNAVNSNSSPMPTNVNSNMNQSMTLPNLNASFISPNSNTNLNWNKPAANMMQFQSNFTSGVNAVQMSSPSSNVWSNNKSFTSPKANNIPNNWNSLDKLLPSNANKVPMNQMTSDQQTMPLLGNNTSPFNNSSNNNSKNSNITPLSNKDLMDFLT